MATGDWDPRFVADLRRVVEEGVAPIQDELRQSQDRVHELEHRCKILSDQLRGGFRDVDPRTNADHPGHVLIRLGWTFCPEEPDEPDDEIGAYWTDPEEKGTGTHTVRSLPAALAIACRRLLDKACKTRLERLVEDGDV
jgi:hypothetical protein